MKSIIRLFVLLTLLTLSKLALASGNGIGIDLIRMVDSGQIVGNSTNIIYQKPLKAGTAAWFSFTLADNDNYMFEGAYKAYTGSYMSGTYYQAGVALWDTRNNSDLGISGAVGYETSPAKGFLFFGTVKAMLVPDIGFQYTPMLGAMFVF